MRFRPLVIAAALSSTLAAAAPATASANHLWCMGDPPQQVSTASGTNVTININLYTSEADRHLDSKVTDTITQAPDGAGGTLFTVQVTVPSGMQSLLVVASVHGSKLSASGQGVGGSVITLTLDVPKA